MRATLLIGLVAVEIVISAEILYAQPNPERDNQQAQQENIRTTCDQETTLLGGTLGCILNETGSLLSPLSISGHEISLPCGSENYVFSPPCGSGHEMNSTESPPVDDRPSERRSVACYNITIPPPEFPKFFNTFIGNGIVVTTAVTKDGIVVTTAVTKDDIVVTQYK